MRVLITKTVQRCMIIALLAVALPSQLTAQYTYNFRDSLGTYKVQFTPHNMKMDVLGGKIIKRPLSAGTDEWRIGIGAFAETPLGITSDSSLPYIDTRGKDYYYGDTRWITLTSDYGRWLKEWLYIGASVTWTAGIEYRYSRYEHRRYGSRTFNAINLMPMVRFAYLRRGIVQLYSGIGLGVSFGILENDKDRGIFDKYAALDVTFIGLSVGRNLFGYIDFGTSSRGVITAGIGYRFKYKK